ncbi:MAG: nucleotide exchange factor GrpE [Treponema sp.]|jgi:molecular chaperone GrpE|nr:nucleotide exchange factor GrpE [Treponema sp.]
MSKHFSYNKKQEPMGDDGAGVMPEQAVDPGADGVAGDDSQGETGAGNRESGDSGCQPSGNKAGGAGGPAAGEVSGQNEAAESGPEDRAADLEAQLADAKDQFLRKAADFENFRKRMNREKQDAIDFANQNLLLDIVPILDDFDRAIQSADISRDFNALYEGVGMIAKRLSSTLESKWGLKSYTAAGTPFDPNFHEALMMEKSSAVTEQTVQADLLKGYTLKDRVIRSAKVKVLDPDPSAPAIEAPKAAEDTVEGEGKAEPEAQA